MASAHRPTPFPLCLGLLDGCDLWVRLDHPLGCEFTPIRDHGHDSAVVGLEAELDDAVAVHQVARVERHGVGLQPVEQTTDRPDRRRVVEIQQADLEVTVDDLLTDVPLGIVGRPSAGDAGHR